MLKRKRKGLADYLRNNHPHKAGIIVSKSKKMIYMKPTKTAGTTVLWHFLDKEIDDLIHLDENPEEFTDWIKNLTDEDLEEYIIFAVVRNPYDRFVSSSSYLKIPFKSLVSNFNVHIKDDVNYRHTLPQHYYTHINKECFVDLICRFETLGTDMNLVCDQLGIERRVLPRTNISEHKDYSTYYSENDKKVVNTLYKLDFKLYGYAFEKFKVVKVPLMKRIIRKLFN
jgi:hypothetical protein